MTINNTTFYTDLYTEVRTVLLAASITNPDGDTPEVLGSYNDKKATRPQIIIEPANLSEARYKFGSTEGKKIVNLTITIYDKKRGNVNSVLQQVQAAIKANDFDDLMLTEMSTDDAFVNPNDAKYHSLSLIHI